MVVIWLEVVRIGEAGNPGPDYEAFDDGSFDERIIVDSSPASMAIGGHQEGQAVFITRPAHTSLDARARRARRCPSPDQPTLREHEQLRCVHQEGQAVFITRPAHTVYAYPATRQYGRGRSLNFEFPRRMCEGLVL